VRRWWELEEIGIVKVGGDLFLAQGRSSKADKAESIPIGQQLFSLYFNLIIRFTIDDIHCRT